MVETMAWEKMKRLSDNDQCRLYRKQKETVQHLLAGCEKLASTEYVRRHNNALKVLAVWWAINNGILPPDTKWWKENWTKGRVIQRNGYKLLWDWEHRMRTMNTMRRPELTLEDKSRKMICFVNMTCPYESNIHKKRIKKLKKIPAIGVRIARMTWTIQGHGCTLSDWMLGRRYKTVNQGH